MSRAPVSVIIPVRNALPRLQDCLQALVIGLVQGLVLEAIVVDGGSSDHSADLALDMGCKLIALPENEAGRGRQLRAGAQAARGQWLLFLHGDTVLAPNWAEAVDRHIAQHSNQAAYFTLAFDQDGAGPRRVAFWANWRAHHLGLPYGDQGLLVPRDLYDAIGGYLPLPLMEDVDLVGKIGKARLVQLACVAQTSATKFETGGWWRVPIRNLALLSAYLLGVKPDVLARLYR